MAEKPEEKFVLSVAGDVSLPGTILFASGKIIASDEEKGKKVLDHVAPYFRASQFNFFNLESPISSKGQPAPIKPSCFRSYPSMLEVLKKSRIDFVGVANNHTLDYGWEALEDTLELLRQNGIAYSGAGKNIAEARKPAIVRKDGMTVGFLSYTANVNTPLGFQASEARHGLAPMRISPFIVPDHCNKEDLEAMRNDVQKWKKEVDFLGVSFHWGISDGGTHTLTIHQEVMGRNAVEAGADLVVGHHSHALQAVEFYRGKPIVYGLGNFALSFEEGFPRESMLLQCRISRHKVHELAFLPVYISDENRPEVVSPSSEDGQKVIAVMQKVCKPFGTEMVVTKGSEKVLLKGRAPARKYKAGAVPKGKLAMKAKAR